MRFDEYEEVIQQTAIYPDAGKGTQVALSYTALGLTEEAGEFAGKISKWIRDGVIDKRLAAKELGDTLWQLTASANELGYRLQDIAEMNLVKLYDRKKREVLGGSGDER